MDKGLIRLAYVALASSALTPGCSGSDSRRTTGGDASPDGPTGSGGSQSTGTGGKAAGGGGVVGTGGATGGGGAGGAAEAGIDASAGGAAEAGCASNDTDGMPPTITSAALIAPDEIRLTFSEPVRPPTGVDPTRFRLSAGSQENREGPIYTTYQDLALFLGQDGGTGEYSVSSITGACGPTLTAKLTTPLPTSELCAVFEGLSSSGTLIPGTLGLYLHFRDAAAPTVEDGEGLVLASISPAWATPSDGGALLSTLNVLAAGSALVDAVHVPVRCGDAGF